MVQKSKPTYATVAALVDACGGPAAFGRACGFTSNPHARGGDFKRRGSIPVDYWPSIIEFARAQKIPGVTYKAIVEAHVGRKLD